jgi:CheY-like chemotaxis protein
VKDQFLATMSHEMRTPLHGILGLARLVHKRLPARAGPLGDARHQVELIERTGEHLLGIINDVLDFSRIEAGRLQVEHTPFDLQTVMLDVLTLLTITASDKGLHLVTEVELPDPCWVKGDPARVRQVLHNLVGNAIKFTESGQVSVRVKRAPGAGATPEGDPPLLFEVEDTGIGIPPHHLPLIFEAFHQVDGSFGRRHHGTGLGLTISREIARAMGGDITCRSTPGQGSVFSLTVPLPSAPVHQVDVALPLGHEAEAKATTGRERCQGHVLLAEDNPVNALVAEAALANLGLQVTRVEDGEQALAALQRPGHGFDLVLMDCQMPVLDGIEATRRLRAWEHAQGHAPIAVVALTANALSSDRERCMAAGMNEHLAKPFRQEALLAVLQRHLGALPTTSPGLL